MRFLIVRLRHASGEKIASYDIRLPAIVNESALHDGHRSWHNQRPRLIFTSRGIDARQAACSNRRIPAEPTAVVRAAKIVSDATPGRDSKPVETREPARHRGARLRAAGHPRTSRSGPPGGTHD